MSVASHLQINLEEYDALIGGFVPAYDVMVATAADALMLFDNPAPHILDLGIGTGALSARCLDVRPDATLTGIDSDAEMLAIARSRLARHPRVTLIDGSFLTTTLPACDAIVACISLHHVRTEREKRALYVACRRVLSPGGLLINADCFPAKDEVLAEKQRRAWFAQLEQRYTKEEADSYMNTWAGEDRYVPLEDELAWLRDAGFQPEVVWRAGGFGVIAARNPS
ncbi:MAG: class I SAM-dependent methyltransferase [Longimicrobiales bacterium]